MTRHIFRGVTALALTAITASISAPAFAIPSGEAGANAEILINATPKVVWRAVHQERFQDPELCAKVLEHGAMNSTIEEKFLSVPILGQVTAVLAENEEPYKRIDYSLISSDKFKRLEGSWLFTPVNGGKQTLLRLSSMLDVGVPFSHLFIRSATQKKISRRISNVKRIAEAEQAQLAASGREDL